jgi:hypothetical protein
VDTGISKKKNGGAGKGRFLEGQQNFLGTTVPVRGCVENLRWPFLLRILPEFGYLSISYVCCVYPVDNLKIFILGDGSLKIVVATLALY